MPSPDFKMSDDTRTVLAHLMTKQVAETVTYGEIARLIGRNQLDSSSAALRTAIRRIMKDEGRVFACIRNIGVIRLDDAGVVAESTANKRRLFRAGKRYGKRLANITDYASLPKEKQMQHSINTAIFSAVSLAASDKAERRAAALAAEASAVAKSVDLRTTIAETIASFRR